MGAGWDDLLLSWSPVEKGCDHLRNSLGGLLRIRTVDEDCKKLDVLWPSWGKSRQRTSI